ncbi:MAG: DUF167 domain-containing protein [Candidatus Margulisbacteria bacterium]|jgi:uncharacterized protein (TIGR00251 family)|nr:DUF167 domain-containing protein [Candidatus Margulisiibacteriota bacterium]
MKQKIALYIQPGARQNGFAGYFAGQPKIKIKSPAQGNKANQELCAFLARKLNLPKSGIAVIQGRTSRHKIISIESNLSAAEILLNISKIVNFTE